MGGRRGAGWSGGGGKGDNCNSIINKYILKSKNTKKIKMFPTVGVLNTFNKKFNKEWKSETEILMLLQRTDK